MVDAKQVHEEIMQDELADWVADVETEMIISQFSPYED